MTVDAVVVGSGPGGAAAAHVLTKAGWTVTIVEKGSNHLIDPEPPFSLRQDFSNDEIKFVARWFLGPDPLAEPRTFRRGTEDGERLFSGEVNSAVGRSIRVADSMATEAVTMKIISRTRKISVSGVMLISQNIPPWP